MPHPLPGQDITKTTETDKQKNDAYKLLTKQPISMVEYLLPFVTCTIGWMLHHALLRLQ